MNERERCPIENPFYCIGFRCQITGICDFNRRREAIDEAERVLVAALHPNQDNENDN